MVGPWKSLEKLISWLFKQWTSKFPQWPIWLLPILNSNPWRTAPAREKNILMFPPMVFPHYHSDAIGISLYNGENEGKRKHFPPSTVFGIIRWHQPFSGYPVRYQRNTIIERRACCRISILGLIPVNITLFPLIWVWGVLELHAQGCLERTLNVVFEMLSVVHVVVVSFFFSPTVE